MRLKLKKNTLKVELTYRSINHKPGLTADLNRFCTVTMGSLHMCLALFTPLTGFTVQRVKILAPGLSLGSWSLGVAHKLVFLVSNLS